MVLRLWNIFSCFYYILIFIIHSLSSMPGYNRCFNLIHWYLIFYPVPSQLVVLSFSFFSLWCVFAHLFNTELFLMSLLITLFRHKIGHAKQVTLSLHLLFISCPCPHRFLILTVLISNVVIKLGGNRYGLSLFFITAPWQHVWFRHLSSLPFCEICLLQL